MASEEIWEVYPEVYHYTKFSTALLIIHSATLRATRFDLLNDTQEIIYAKDTIATKLLEKLSGATIQQAKQDLENFYIVMGNTIYITSFCGQKFETNHCHRDNGLLSMWRNYGADGGCAIVFNAKNIYDKTSSTWISLDIPPAIVMDKVIYKGENDNDKDYLDRLDHFADSVSKFLNNQSVDWKKQIEDLLCLMICSKHSAFFEEREVRIGLCFKGNQGVENQALSPQRFHSIPFSPAQDIPRIIIGPHRDKQERYNFLKSYLSKIASNIDVTMSEIPLRF